MGVFLRLADFDGKSIMSLKAIKSSFEVSTELLDELVEIVGTDDANLQIGATWMIRAYLEDGAQLESQQVERLSGLLAAMKDGFGRLHVCQCMHLIRVPDPLAESFADFFRTCLASKNTFLRAWAPSGFWRLADQHPRYEPEARALIEKALADPAASVRARARMQGDCSSTLVLSRK